MSLPTLPSVGLLLKQFSERGIVLPPGPVRVDAYGDSEALSRELLELIRLGKKRAGTGLLWPCEAEAEPLPKAGDIEIVVDYRNAPTFVTRISGALAVCALGVLFARMPSYWSAA